MYQILVVWALSQELNVIRKKIKTLNIPGLKIDFLQTWMWNYNTIFALTKKLEQKQYDFIMNIGVGWIRRMTKDLSDDFKWWKKISPKSPKISTSPFYQVSNIFELETWKELIVPIFFKFWPLSSCISANKAIKYEDSKFSNLNSQFSLLDMESYGFEFVLEKYNLPRIILKVPVDTNDEELENFDYQKALNLLWENIDYEQLLLETKKYLDNTKKEDLKLEKYFHQLLFSQRQREIFEFLYRKYNIVVWWNFDKFFDDFLQKNKNFKNRKQLVAKMFEELENLFG